jgi:integrase
MTIRYETRNGVPGYDIRFPLEDIRERRAFPKELHTTAVRRRWAEQRAGTLLRDGRKKEVVPAQTLAEFGPRWLLDYVDAEGLKPSTKDAYERILRLHLYPPIGEVRLDAIGELHVQKVKLCLAGKSEKTRHGVLSLLAELLRAAERWDEIVKAPKIKLPRFMKPEMEFYDFDEWERLIAGARLAGPMQLAAVLLGGDAGLRPGELVAFEQGDADATAVTVQRNEWRGQVGKPKGGKTRRVPMTPRLRKAIAAVRHLRGARLLWQASGLKAKLTTLQSWMEVSCKRAGLPPSRNLHKLRHTFCSHLALKGAPARVIQELAGHADLATTMRYMHLAKGSKESAIALLTQRVEGSPQGRKNGGKRKTQQLR